MKYASVKKLQISGMAEPAVRPGMRGRGGEGEREGRAAPRRRNPIGVQLFKPNLSNLLTPLSLSEVKRFLQFLFEGKFPLS